LIALDLMRGFVMVLMAIDHASGALNGGRVFSDAARFYHPGTLLDPAQFLTRFVTHLCAPTFVFLSGAAGALSSESRLRAGESARYVDGHLVARGLLIAALDPLWMSWGFTGGHIVLFQVLYAIGMSMCAMALLRRLPTALMLALGLALCVFSEAMISAVSSLFGADTPPLAAALLLTGGQFDKLVIAYPVLPWLAIMLLGWAFGRWLAVASSQRLERASSFAGLAGLALFGVVRAINGYGNMRLPRDDGSLVQWLHVSKYPPSLGYYGLELGIMALSLAGFSLASRKAEHLAPLEFLRVLGQTAFFFYLLHVHLLEAVASLFGWGGKFGLAAAYIGGIAIVAFLFPACVYYLRYKRAHPHGWTRYI
jgi:uncharacterized membrane protein